MTTRDTCSSSNGIATIDLDQAIERTGPQFRFQILLQVCMFYVVLTTCYNFISSTFTGNEPSWRCTNNASNAFCTAHFNKTFNNYDEHFSEKCKMNRSDWEFTAVKEYSYVAEFDLICDRTTLAAFVSSSFYMGGILGTIFSGFFADTYGRKPVLLFSLLVLISSSIGYSYNSDIWVLIGINLIRGFAGVANYYTIYVYLTEFVVPTNRAFSTGVLIFAADTSFLLLDLLAYKVRKWRHLQLYLALLPLPGILAFALFPASPRWLLSKGRERKAYAVVGIIAKFNRKTIVNDFCLTKPNTLDDSKYTYLDLLRKLEIFKTTCCVSVLWFAATLLYYTIIMEATSMGDNKYISFAESTLADFFACIACTYLLNRFGRKKPIVSGLFISGVLMGCMLLIPKYSSWRLIAKLIISTIARFMVCISFNGMFTWISELFPTVLRSQGMSVSVIFERLAMFCCPFITRILKNIDSNLPLIITCVVGILASFFGLLLPETNHRPTRERYEDFFRNTVRTTNEFGIDNAEANIAEERSI